MNTDALTGPHAEDLDQMSSMEVDVGNSEFGWEKNPFSEAVA